MDKSQVQELTDTIERELRRHPERVPSKAVLEAASVFLAGIEGDRPC